MANRSVAHHPLVPGFSWIWVHGHRCQWDTLGRGTECQGSVTVQTSQRPLHAPVRRNSDLATSRGRGTLKRYRRRARKWHRRRRGEKASTTCQPRKRANSMTPERFWTRLPFKRTSPGKILEKNGPGLDGTVEFIGLDRTDRTDGGVEAR